MSIENMTKDELEALRKQVNLQLAQLAAAESVPLYFLLGSSDRAVSPFFREKRQAINYLRENIIELTPYKHFDGVTVEVKWFKPYEVERVLNR